MKINIDANEVIKELVSDNAIKMAQINQENAVLKVQVRSLVQRIEELEAKSEDVKDKKDKE